jgi:hypothetical protein
MSRVKSTKDTIQPKYQPDPESLVDSIAFGPVSKVEAWDKKLQTMKDHTPETCGKARDLYKGVASGIKGERRWKSPSRRMDAAKALMLSDKLQWIPEKCNPKAGKKRKSRTKRHAVKSHKMKRKRKQQSKQQSKYTRKMNRKTNNRRKTRRRNTRRRNIRRTRRRNQRGGTDIEGLQKYTGRLGFGIYEIRNAKIEGSQLVTTKEGEHGPKRVQLEGKSISKLSNDGTNQGYYIKLAGRGYRTSDWYKFETEEQRDTAFNAMKAVGAMDSAIAETAPAPAPAPAPASSRERETGAEERVTGAGAVAPVPGRAAQMILDEQRLMETYKTQLQLIQKIPILRDAIFSETSLDGKLLKAQKFSSHLEKIFESDVLTQLGKELTHVSGSINRTFQFILLAAYNYPQLSEVLIDMRRYIDKAPSTISLFWLEELKKLLMEGGDQGKKRLPGKKLQLVMYMAQKYPDFIFNLCQDFQDPKPSEIQYILALFEEYDEKGNVLHRLKSASTLVQGLQARQESEPEPQSDPEQEDLMRRLEELKSTQ